MKITQITEQIAPEDLLAIAIKEAELELNPASRVRLCVEIAKVRALLEGLSAIRVTLAEGFRVIHDVIHKQLENVAGRIV